ncbi:oxoglutarate-dependent flavonoid 7-O-demethylase 1-like [Gastrolobium bilobum]|uniref:oxoglutarate-dependent flavonoid 7-O-demethylase 1-like n=1 Tax=Gastrolobium bilobum TaxID=150636 RepID=UPI002AB14FD7|nr:oxoglutarate-dependent flavonoid 7-O-demethylase 1-like [Gastrolobium bilobum]
MKNLAIQIIDLMANALTLDTKEIRELFGEGAQSIRMNYYPPCPQPELVMGLNPHSDGGGHSILLQAKEVEGLQIRKGGLWIPIEPLPNVLIINIGDTLEVENVKTGAQEFFNLPKEEKNKFGKKEGDVEGYGQVFCHEQKLESADMFFILTLPPHIRKPHLFRSTTSPYRSGLGSKGLNLRINLQGGYLAI